MNDSVDYQIELHLRNLEDELKSAEQQYLEKIQCIVAKYTNRATELREKVCATTTLSVKYHYFNSSYLVIKGI